MGMKQKFFEIVKNNIFYQCAYNLIKHEAIEYAGYLTYLNVLSVFPFIFIFFALISGFYRIYNLSMVKFT